MKLRNRAVLWGAAAARLWAAHWLLMVGSFSVLVSVILKWVNFPLSPDPSGLSFPLLRNVGLIPHITLLSYGIVALAALGSGLLLLRFGGLSLGAAILVTLCVMVPCQIAFVEPALLRRLTDEAPQVSQIRSFTREYLPQNYGPTEEISKATNLSTAWGRFLTACSFLAPGWYCFGFGSLLIAVHAIRRLPTREPLMTAALIGLPVGAFVILLTPALLGQYYFNSAWAANAQGDTKQTIANYRKAMQWDRWYKENIDLYALIGDLELQAGFLDDSPERHVNKARQLRDASQYELAIFEFNVAAKTGGALGAAAQREAARTQVDFGRALYRAGGIGAAINLWREALAEDPLQVCILPYLARANYDIGRYQTALDLLDRVVGGISEESVLANAYSVAGDCYAKLGRDADARRYYRLSLKLDTLANHWALAGLTGE